MKATLWFSGIVVISVLAAAEPTARAIIATESLAGRLLQIDGPSVSVRCPLSIGGGFDAKTAALRGELALNPGRPGVVDGELSVDLRTLRTGIALRDEHMRENYLQVGRGPSFEVARLTDIRIEGVDVANPAGNARFQGRLTLHGVTREVTGTASIRSARQALRVQATVAVNVSSFEIQTPSYLGVGVGDALTVTVSFTLQPTPQNHASAILRP